MLFLINYEHKLDDTSKWTCLCEHICGYISKWMRLCEHIYANTSVDTSKWILYANISVDTSAITSKWTYLSGYISKWIHVDTSKCMRLCEHIWGYI